jgi:addiction module HigA family antidote
MTTTSQFEPNYFSPPGDTLAETIEALGMTQVDLAMRLGVTPKHVNQLMSGKAPITSETALHLEHITGVPASFWMNREKNYREALARQEELEELSKHAVWLKDFPLKEMIQRGWIAPCKEKAPQIREMLRFFKVATPKAWEAKYKDMAFQFRRSSKKECRREPLSVWLQAGENMAVSMETAPYDAEGFHRALMQSREWSMLPPAEFTDRLKTSFARHGVVILFVPEFKGMPVSGVTRWLTPHKALMQVSLRFKTNDHLWFTIFHEAGHILKHAKKQIFLECGPGSNEDWEREADAFAANTLIPPAEFSAFTASTPILTRKAIEAFAGKVGIASGIVVGRLQHEGRVPYSWGRELKITYKWAD